MFGAPSSPAQPDARWSITAKEDRFQAFAADAASPVPDRLPAVAGGRRLLVAWRCHRHCLREVSRHRRSWPRAPERSSDTAKPGGRWRLRDLGKLVIGRFAIVQSFLSPVARITAPGGAPRGDVEAASAESLVSGLFFEFV